MASVYLKRGTWYLSFRDANGRWRVKASIAKTKIDEEPGIRFDADTNRFYDEFLPDLVRRVPEFAGLGLVSGWGGLYEMTPDHNGILGGHPTIEGLYFACGFSGHGLMMSPATGASRHAARGGRAGDIASAGRHVWSEAQWHR